MLLPLSILLAAAVAVSAKYNSPEVGVPGLYKGLIAWAFVWAFVDAYSIGANDVANAFANAVGSGTLTHRGACMVACFFELGGAIALGSQVTDTIRTKVTLFPPLMTVTRTTRPCRARHLASGGGIVIAPAVLHAARFSYGFM